MSIDPADYWMTPDEERKLEDKLADRRVHYLEANEYIVDGDESLNNGNSPSGSDEPQDCPNCPNQGWYAVQYTHADGTLDQCQQQCEWCYTIPNSKFNQNART